MHFQHYVDDILKGRIVDSRPFVNPVASVEPHMFGWYSLKAVVHRLYIHFCGLSPLGAAQGRVTVDIGEEGVVDLNLKAGIDDRPILAAHGLCHRGHESDTSLELLQGGLEVIEVSAHRLLSAVADGPGAHQRNHGRDRTAEHGVAEVLLIVLWKGRHLSGKER